MLHCSSTGLRITASKTFSSVKQWYYFSKLLLEKEYWWNNNFFPVGGLFFESKNGIIIKLVLLNTVYWKSSTEKNVKWTKHTFWIDWNIIVKHTTNVNKASISWCIKKQNNLLEKGAGGQITKGYPVNNLQATSEFIVISLQNLKDNFWKIS